MRKLKKIIAMAMAVCIAAGGMVGCSFDKKDSVSGTKIKWYIPANTKASKQDTEIVYSKAAKMVKEKLNIDLELVSLAFGDYESKIQVINASNEQFDIMFTSNWANNYYHNISRKTLVALDDLLKNETKSLYQSIPGFLWDATKVNGKIYGVPNQQIAAREPCFIIPEQNIKSLNIDVKEFENLKDDYKVYLDAVEKYLKMQKDGSGTYAKCSEIWRNEATQVYGIEQILGSQLPGAIKYNSNEPTKLINQYKTQEFKDYLEYRKKWMKEGLIQPQVEDERSFEEYKGENKVYPEINRTATYTPSTNLKSTGVKDYDKYILIHTKPILTTGGAISTLNGISTTSKTPSEALKVIELVNTDKELYNMLCFGMEGDNYTKIGENKIQQSPDREYTAPAWAIGSVYNSYLLPFMKENVWEETKAINADSKRSPLLGFGPDTTKLKAEIAGCKSAIDEYLEILMYAACEDVDATYQEFIRKMDAAGADKIIEEVQKQIDEWLSNKH